MNSEVAGSGQLFLNALHSPAFTVMIYCFVVRRGSLYPKNSNIKLEEGNFPLWCTEGNKRPIGHAGIIVKMTNPHDAQKKIQKEKQVAKAVKKIGKKRDHDEDSDNEETDTDVEDAFENGIEELFKKSVVDSKIDRLTPIVRMVANPSHYVLLTIGNAQIWQRARLQGIATLTTPPQKLLLDSRITKKIKSANAVEPKSDTNVINSIIDRFVQATSGSAQPIASTSASTCPLSTNCLSLEHADIRDYLDFIGLSTRREDIAQTLEANDLDDYHQFICPQVTTEVLLSLGFNIGLVVKLVENVTRYESFLVDQA